MVKLTLEERFDEYLRATGGWWTPERVSYLVDSHFGSLPLENRSVIEIGAGSGIFSAACAARGASRVVSLEPEVAGSSEGVHQEYRKMADAVGFGGVIDYRTKTLDQFVATDRGARFDYIVLKAVINHIDEEAVTRLHLTEANKEREAYISIFRKMGELLSTRGVMIMSDAARQNFWNCIGVKPPFQSSIEWHKHQQPKVWKEILNESGFRKVHVRWPTPFRLRRLRYILLGPIPAFFLLSSFVITASKPDKDRV